MIERVSKLEKTDMDEGPFRSSRPVDRRGASRPEPQRQQAEPQQVRQEPQATEQSAAQQRTASKNKSIKRNKLPLLVALIIIAILIVGGLLWFGSRSTGTSIDTSKYQAVFLANGQIYFGKLELPSGEYMKLTDVYYLQTQTEDGAETDDTQATTAEQSKVQLIKLGEKELHAPEDLMIISKDQVLYYENLKDEGKVVQSIEQFKKSK